MESIAKFFIFLLLLTFLSFQNQKYHLNLEAEELMRLFKENCNSYKKRNLNGRLRLKLVVECKKNEWIKY